MLIPRHDLALRGRILPKLVGNQGTGKMTLSCLELAHQPHSNFPGAAAPDQNIKHEHLLIERAPEPVFLSPY